MNELWMMGGQRERLGALEQLTMEEAKALLADFYRIFPAFERPHIYRASGEMECKLCGELYRQHPSARVAWAMAAEDFCTVHVLCNGDLVKL